jgi:glucokinase
MSRRDELQKLILHRLLFHGRTTRPELVALTGCRAATVFEVIDVLKSVGIVIEPERRGKKTGRRAPELECNRDYACFLGLELRTSGIFGVVTDSRGDTVEEYTEQLPAHCLTMVDIRAGILRGVSSLLKNIGDKRQLLRGVGFADPGLVDLERGVSLRAVNIPGWKNHATAEWLAKNCNVPAGIWPEQMIRTRMEYITRLPDAPESLFHLGTDGGIGGGFIKAGRLFVGSTCQSMEIGHIVITPGGAVCSCGNRGCLEAVAGKQGILNLVRKALRSGVATELSEVKFSIRRFVECSHRDKAARIIADEVSEHIGSALATVVTLLNPETIVLSGELTGLGDIMLDAVHRVLERNCFADAIRRLKLEISTLEPCDTARGAAIMMRDRIFGIGECA